MRSVPGVARARAFVSHTIQREFRGLPLRMVVHGLSWPDDDGRWLPIVAGRSFARAHYEMVADRTLGLRLGDQLTLGKDVFHRCGPDGRDGGGKAAMASLFSPCATHLPFSLTPPARRSVSSGRHAGGGPSAGDLGRTQPSTVERSAGPSIALPALGTDMVSAIMVNVAAGSDAAAVARTISAWSDVTVYDATSQADLLLKGIERNRKQLAMFRTLLIIISAIVMALILYTLTLDKVHDIAMLKLMGARNRVVIALVLQEALLLGAVGYCVAYVIGLQVFPLFPRRVLIIAPNLVQLAGIVVAISVLSSLLGILKAMSVKPNEVLS